MVAKTSDRMPWIARFGWADVVIGLTCVAVFLLIDHIGWFTLNQRYPGLSAIVGAATGLSASGMGVFLFMKPLMAWMIRRERGPRSE